MGLDEAALILMLIGGIAVAAAGINIYRYAVIIMSAAGGYCLANMLFAGAVGGNVGNGVFKDMDGSAGQSFIVAIFVFAGAVLFGQVKKSEVKILSFSKRQIIVGFISVITIFFVYFSIVL